MLFCGFKADMRCNFDVSSVINVNLVYQPPVVCCCVVSINRLASMGKKFSQREQCWMPGKWLLLTLQTTWARCSTMLKTVSTQPLCPQPSIIIELFSDMSGGAKRKTVPAKLDLTEEQKSDIKEAFRWSPFYLFERNSDIIYILLLQPVRHSKPGSDRLQRFEGCNEGFRLRAQKRRDQENGVRGGW